VTITLVAAAALLASGRRRSAAVVAASLLAGVVCSILKEVFATTRPPGANVVDAFGDPSFAYPSAHVTRFLALWGTLAVVAVGEAALGNRVRRWALAALVGIGTVAMGLARMAAGVHWLSDVIGGALLASAWLALAAWLCRVPAQSD
jgi:undecaprenyl-diphosphatase